MSKVLLVCIVGLVLAACAATQSSQRGLDARADTKQLAIRDVEWVSALISQSQNDPNRVCLDGSLQTSFALVAFKDGGYDDKAIEAALLIKLPNTKLRALRKADYAEWVRTHEPASVATKHFNGCLADNGNSLIASDAWLRCFFATQPAALLSIYRRSARPMSDAVQAVIPYYPITASAGDIAALAKQIYALTLETEDIQLREQVFVGCLNRK